MRRTKGFTLVELLVVIGIIALLISILLPSLARARQAALALQCQSNMRQMGQAFQFYINDYKGSLPPASVDWQFYPYPYSEFRWYYFMASVYLPGSVASASYDWMQNPYSMAKTRGNSIYNCPADYLALNNDTVANNGIGMSFAANFYVMRRKVSPTNPTVKASRVQDSSGVILLVERKSDMYCEGGNGMAPNISEWPPRAYQYLSTLPALEPWNDAKTDPMPPLNSGPHGGGQTLNILFVDGHVSAESFNEVCYGQRGLNGTDKAASDHRWGVDQKLQ